jgi:hypothetical protein
MHEGRPECRVSGVGATPTWESRAAGGHRRSAVRSTEQRHLGTPPCEPDGMRPEVPEGLARQFSLSARQAPEAEYLGLETDEAVATAR